ncbi:MAG: hypothetical protein P8L18_15990 [Verrucomicrobiota bacterium]|nr:hypothetical protein [Verrucomicrobiota bacterium]
MEKLTSAAVSIGVTAVVSCVLAYLASHALNLWAQCHFLHPCPNPVKTRGAASMFDGVSA